MLKKEKSKISKEEEERERDSYQKRRSELKMADRVEKIIE